jgi:hypothetical protein
VFWFHGILWELGAIKVTALWITILTWGFATQPCNAFNKSFLWFHLCSCSHTIWIYPYKYPFGGLILKGLGQVSSQVRPSIIDHLTVLFFWPATALLSERANSILRWDTEEWHVFFLQSCPRAWITKLMFDGKPPMFVGEIHLLQDDKPDYSSYCWFYVPIILLLYRHCSLFCSSWCCFPSLLLKSLSNKCSWGISRFQTQVPSFRLLVNYTPKKNPATYSNCIPM